MVYLPKTLEQLFIQKRQTDLDVARNPPVSFALPSAELFRGFPNLQFICIDCDDIHVKYVRGDGPET